MSKKKKIIISFLSFAFVVLLSCGIALLPNWNPSPTTPPSDIGQEEGVFETEAATQPTNTSGKWTDSGIRGTSFGGGSGTASDPYIISNAQQLAYLAYMVNNGNSYSGKYFEQTANIDLSAYYWEPIGIKKNKNYPFSGNYTANPFGVITNLYTKSDYDYAGLFGSVKNATISNIGISGGYIEGGDYTGGLVGYAEGDITITNCYNTGNVTSTSSNSYAGGLVGQADIITITNSYNTGNVTARSSGTYSYAGGLVGRVSGTTTITNCYNTGNVTTTTSSSTYSYAGGVVGCVLNTTITIENSYNTGDVNSSDSHYSYAGGVVGSVGDDLTITGSYNTGNVTSTSYYSYAGGLVGRVFGTTTITNCYNTGDVTSTSSSLAYSYAGGLVGYISDGSLSSCHNIGDISPPSPARVRAGAIAGATDSSITFTKCYYYCEGASGGVNGVDVSGTSENANLLSSDIIFRSQSDYTNTALWTDPFWDFDNTWKIVNDMNGNYPVLIELTEFTLTVNPNGGTWNGSSSSQNFTQNFNTTKTIANPVRYGYYFDGWILLGSGSISGTTFTFGGGDCTLIANWIETWAVNYTKPSGNGTASSPYQVDSASDLAYFAYKTQIQGQVSYDYIVLTDDIDLAGYDWMPIGTGRYVVSGVQACFSGTFDGQGHTISNLNINVLGQQVLDEYGLFGLTDINAVLKNFTILSGQVNGFNTSTSAVVGYTWRSTIDNVTNYANVTGNNYVGGIIGTMQRTSKISNCFNYGNVQGINYVGGVVGGTEDSTETRSIVGVTNMGQVSGHSQVGGIIGRAYHVTVESAYNGYTASVTATTRYAGGVVGYLMQGSTVLKSVNTADVTGLECVAGLVGGAVNGGSLTTSYSEGLISARGSSVTEAGTLVGGASTGMAIADCYFKGASNKSIGTYYGSKYVPAIISNCYVKLNGTLSKTAGSFDNWTIVSGVNDNDPIQKELFYLAGYTGGDEMLRVWLEDRNILSDPSFEYNDWVVYSGTSSQDTEHVRSGKYSWKFVGESSRWETYNRTLTTYEIDPTHEYFVRLYAYQEEQVGEISVYWQSQEPSVGTATMGPAGKWNMYGWKFDRVGFSGSQIFRIDFDNSNQTGELWVDDVLLIDLTEMYGAGNEPSQEECMILFA